MVRPRTAPTTRRPSWPMTRDAGPVRQVAVRHRDPAGEGVGEIAEPRAEDDRDLRDIGHSRANRVGGFPDPIVIRQHLYSRNPAMLAVMKFASVPANIARSPSRARSWRRLGASAPMPPIWMPIEPKFANPHSAKVAMVNDRGSSSGLQRPELRVGDELVEHHARAEQIADRGRVAPRHAHAPRHRREHPAEDLLQAQVREAEQRVDQRDEGDERDQHRGDVERQMQPLTGSPRRRVDDVHVGLLPPRAAPSPSSWASRSRGRASLPS